MVHLILLEKSQGVGQTKERANIIQQLEDVKKSAELLLSNTNNVKSNIPFTYLIDFAVARFVGQDLPATLGSDKYKLVYYNL